MSCLCAPPDVDRAHEEWGASCGPTAIAAALGKTLDEIRGAVSKGGRFPGYMGVGDVLRALRWLDRSPGRTWSHPRWERVLAELEDPGLVMVQIHGPWLGEPREAAKRRHLVALGRDAGERWRVFDVNEPQWLLEPLWRVVMGKLARSFEGSDGTWSVCWAAQVPRAPERGIITLDLRGSPPAAQRDESGPAPAGGPRPGERVYLVDANNLVHRLFHATPASFAPSDGATPINAVVAWVRQLRALRRRHGVTYLVPIFDGPGESWRRELYGGYKAKRSPPPAELTGQWEPIWRATKALGLAPVREGSLEADDLIAAYAEAAVCEQLEVVVVSNDKDLMQLIRGSKPGPGSVRQLDPFRDRLIGPAEVEAKFGVGPARLGELLALAGDSTDDIPGVPGIGPKIAAALLGEYGDLETLLERAGEVPQPARRRRLLEHAADARLSRQLVALRANVPLPRPLAELPRWEPSRRVLNAFFAELGFVSFRAALDGPSRS